MKRTPLYLAIAGLTLSAGLAPTQAQEQVIEEVVITGSFIKRDSFDSSVPLTVVGADQIEASATPNLGEVLANQTFNYGTDVQTNTYAARSQGGNNSQANLRGLGPRATLNLFDGRRTSNANLNNSLPQIAIERIDVLKDGASALYGTDAVAGVVNIVPDKNFEGTKFNFLRKQTSDRALEENQYEFMVGSPTDNGNVVFAARYADRGELQQVERPRFLREGFERSGTGNPGDWLVPVRDPLTGELTGDDPVRMVDPGCGAFNGSGTDVGVKNNFRSGDPSGGAPGEGNNCRLHFGEFWNYINPQEQISVWSNFTYDFDQNLSNNFDFLFSRLDTDSRGSPQNPGGRTEEFPIVRGDHPGNPFRAMANGNLLYAQDADSDGVPDRDPNADANGDGVPDVILAPLPFDPASGIPFYEDVDVAALRIFGKLGTKPTSFNADGSNYGTFTFDSADYRIADTLTYTIPNSTWEVSGGFVYQRNILNQTEKNTSQSALLAGLSGQLIAAPPTEGGVGPTYWNPFSTQELFCQNRVCSANASDFDPADGDIVNFNNSQFVANAINIEANSVTNTTFYTYDLMAVGDLFDLPTGDTVGLAVGYQYRNDKVDSNLDASRNSCDWHEGGCGFDYRASLDVREVFFESRWPFTDTFAGNYLEFTLAGRYTDYGGNIGESTDPKVSFLYQPIDWMSFRGSWSTAFIAPSIADLRAPVACNLQTTNDPIVGDASQTFRSGCVSSNALLEPETATVYNLGFSVALLEGDLNLGVDYSVYDFEDRISQPTVNQIITRDFNRYLAAGNTETGDPASNPEVAAWIAGGSSDPAINRDPATGLVTRVDIQLLNAQEMKHAAYDFYGTYDIDTDSLGSFTLRLDATYADEYSFDLGEGFASGDGAGRQNEEVAEVPPIPEWRVNLGLSWLMGGHSALVRARWIDGYQMSFNSGALQGAQLAVNGTLEQDPITYIDLNYGYSFNVWGDRETRFELGIQNATDEFPDPILNLGGIETFVHDIRGRQYVLRLVQDI